MPTESEGSKCKWELFVYFSDPRDSELESTLIKAAQYIWGHPGYIWITNVTDNKNHPRDSAVEITWNAPEESKGGGGGETKDSIRCDPKNNGHYIINLNQQAAKRNLYLLAHELGHLFGLDHPRNNQTSPCWEPGDWGTVMVPCSPNLARNTVKQLKVAATSAGLCKKGCVSKIKDPELVIMGGMPETQKEPPPFFIRNYHYDDGRPYSSPIDVLQNHPDANNLKKQYIDADWWGWNSGIWNRHKSTLVWNEDGFGYQHEPPQEGQNWWFVDLTLTVPLEQTIILFFYRVDRYRIDDKDKFMLRPFEIFPDSMAPKWANSFMERITLAVKNVLNVALNWILSRDPSKTNSAWWDQGEGSDEKRPFSIEWKNELSESSPTNEPRHEPSLKTKWDDTWLVAIAWNYQIDLPTIMKEELGNNLIRPSDDSSDQKKRDYEKECGEKFLTFTHTFDDADSFGRWLAENRCVAARRPTAPRPGSSQMGT